MKKRIESVAYSLQSICMGYFFVELSVDLYEIECKSRGVQFQLLPDRFQVCINHTLDNYYGGYGE